MVAFTLNNLPYVPIYMLSIIAFVRMNMRKTLCLIALLGVSACATGPGLQSRMASYTGATEDQLIQKLGVPDKQITVNGVQYLAYDERHFDVSPGFIGFGGGFYGGPFYGPGFGSPFLDAGFPPTVEESGCETTFLLRDGKVASFSFRGNDCT